LSGDRNTEWVTHPTIAAAQAEIESLIGAGTAADNMVIYARPDKDRIDFYPVEHIPAGTTCPGSRGKAGRRCQHRKRENQCRVLTLSGINVRMRLGL
jgi:hypothetical protein